MMKKFMRYNYELVGHSSSLPQYKIIFDFAFVYVFIIHLLKNIYVLLRRPRLDNFYSYYQFISSYSLASHNNFHPMHPKLSWPKASPLLDQTPRPIKLIGRVRCDKPTGKYTRIFLTI